MTDQKISWHDGDLDSPIVSKMSIDRSSSEKTTDALRRAVAFSQIMSILARSPSHQRFLLADLEWLVYPPLNAGQFAVAEANLLPGIPPLPVATVFWAFVSPEVDQRLSFDLASPVQLKPPSSPANHRANMASSLTAGSSATPWKSASGNSLIGSCRPSRSM